MDILSDIGSTFRSVAKELIKGGIYLYDTVSEVAVETGEQFKDLVAEAKADLAKPNYPAEKAEEEADKDDDQDRGERKPRVHVRRSR